MADGKRPGSRSPGGAVGLARALGGFSLGLGGAQLASPHGVNRLVGIGQEDRSRTLQRVVGLRELVAGLGIFASRRPAGWLWARVAGDAMDLAMLGAALRRSGERRGRVIGGMAAVAGVAAADLIAARGLSRARGGQAVRVTAVTTVRRTVDEVYRFWRDLENLPRFMTHLASVETIDATRSRWTATGPAGTEVEWEAEIADDRPDELIHWRSTSGSVPNTGSVRFRRAPGGQGTEVSVTLEYTPPAGRLGAAVAKLLGEEPGQQVRDDLRRFKQVMETGEVVHSDGSPEGMRTARLPRQRPARPERTKEATR